MTTWITICDTCKRDKEVTTDETDGATLAGLIEPLAQQAGLKTRRVSCLMGCAQACNVAVQAEGKLSYTLGRFEPSKDAAQAIVAYATLHQQGESGQVPFRQWPEAIKGHFITRHPPLPQDDTE